MDLRFHAALAGFVGLPVLLFGNLVRGQPTPTLQQLDKTFAEYIAEGFQTPRELEPIYRLKRQEKLAEAQNEATLLIDRKTERFFSLKREQFLKACAYELRGEIKAEFGDDKGAISDLKQAAALGLPSAAYAVAAHLLVLALPVVRGITPNRQDLEEAHRYQLMCAELGVPECIDIVQVALRAKRRSEEENYWFLLERMGEDTAAITQFGVLYSNQFSPENRAFLDKVMSRMSLSGGKCGSATPDLPGRSTLTAAYVDLVMRRQLNFVRRAFFQERRESAYPMGKVFAHRREQTTTNPLTDLWLLVNSRYSAGKNAIAMDSDQLIDSLLPGDDVLVRCGRLSHYAIVWAIEKEKDEVLLLDPFDDFWKPSHNRCVSKFERQPYKYKRQLVRVQLSDLKRMLVAVFSVRDRSV